MVKKQNLSEEAAQKGQNRPLFRLPLGWAFCLTLLAALIVFYSNAKQAYAIADFHCIEDIPCPISVSFQTQDPENDPLTVSFSALPTNYIITSCDLDGRIGIPFGDPPLNCVTPPSPVGPGPFTATGYYEFQLEGSYTGDILICDDSNHCTSYNPTIDVAPFDWYVPDHDHPNALTIGWQWNRAFFATSYDIRVNGVYFTTVPQAFPPVRWNQVLSGYNLSSGSVSVYAVLTSGPPYEYLELKSGPRTHYSQANTPGSPTCTVNSSTQITWNWTNNSNPPGTNYFADNAPPGDSGWITGTQWVQPGLTPNTLYTTLIKARNNDSEETLTVSVGCTTSAGDTQGPTFTFNPPSRVWLSTDISVLLTATDPSGVRYVQYCWGAGVDCDPTQTPGNDLPFNCTGTSPCAATVTQNQNGNWRLCAKGMDSLNNWTNPQVCSSPYQKDNLWPTSNITAPAASSWQRVNFSVSVTDSDTGGSGLTSCLYGVRSWNGLSWIETVPDTTLRSCNTPFTITVGAAGNCRDQGSDRCEVRVRATDAAGNLGSINTRRVSIDWAAPTPNPPNPFIASAQTTTSITWTLPTGSDVGSGLDPSPYRFSRTSGGPYNSAIQATPAWVEGGLSCGTSYTRYGVIQDLAGNITDQAVVTSSTQPCAPPAPTGFVGSNNYSTSQIRWSWNAAAGADTYFVYSNPGGVFQCLATAPTTFCISPISSPFLNPNTALTAHVFAQNAGGDSGWSNDATGYTVPGPVTNLTASNITGTSITWTWNPPSPDGGAGLDYRCSLDGVLPLASCTSPRIAGSLICGTSHQLQVYARNPITGVMGTVVSDTRSTSGCNAATITMNPTSRPWANTNIDVTITATDSDGIDFVRYCWGKGAACNPLQTDGNDPPFNCDGTSPCSNLVTQTDDGNWYLCARAKDGSGAWNNPAVCTNPYQKDTVAPNPAAGAPTCLPNPNNSGAHICTWSAASDSLSGLSSYYVYHQIGGSGSYNSATPSQPTPVTNTTWTPIPAIGENTYRYRIVAMDVAGNSIMGSASSLVTVDKTAPTITTFSPSVTPTASRPVLNWSATETGGSGISKFELWRADYNASTCNGSTMTGCSWSIRVDNIASSATSQEDTSTISTNRYWYGLHAVDNVNNCITETGEHCGGVTSDGLDTRASYGPDQVVFDNTAPTPNPPNPIAASNIGDATITWTLPTGSDSPAGLHATAYGFSANSGGPYNFQGTSAWVENFLSCGTSYTRYGVIRDALGNQTNEASATASTVACTGRSAALSINPVPPSGWDNAPTSVNLNASCVAQGGTTLTSCTAQVDINSSGWVDVAMPYPATYNMSSGSSYQFRAREADTGGFTTSTPVPNPVFQLDTIPPNQVTVSITNSPGGGPAPEDPLTITWTASADNQSGLSHYEVWRSLDFGGVPDPLGWQKVGSDILPAEPRTLNDNPSSSGKWWYGIHILDNAGNMSTEAAWAWGIYDVSAPIAFGHIPNKFSSITALRPNLSVTLNDVHTSVGATTLRVKNEQNTTVFTKNFAVGTTNITVTVADWGTTVLPRNPDGTPQTYTVEIISQDIVGNILVDSPLWTFDQMNQPPSKPSIE